MKHIITINYPLAKELKKHLFKNRKEQGAFLFSDVIAEPDELRLVVKDLYLISPDGWELQEENFLEMKDEERAKIMKIARDKNFAVIDCHSHPGANDYVWFSPSDRRGIEEFAAYARWKLDGKPFAALVWGESSFDGVIWHSDFAKSHAIDALQIFGKNKKILLPQNTWDVTFLKDYKRRSYGRKSL